MARERSALIHLPRFDSVSGNLTFMQEREQIPFDIDHVTWTEDPPDRTRSSEAAVVALHGSFEVERGSERYKGSIRLDRSDRLLHVPAATDWSIRERSAGSISLVASSGPFDSTGSPVVPTTPPRGSLTANATASTIDDCVLVELPQGDGPADGASTLRFDVGADLRIRRVYYISGVPEGRSRGGHAHRALHQFLVAARGAFDVEISDGVARKSIRLSRPNQALMLVPGIWRTLHGFSPGSICLVMASQLYDESDYIRRYPDFRAFKER